MYPSGYLQYVWPSSITALRMSVSSLFSSALTVVVNDAIFYQGEFPYLPGNVRTQVGKVMARRGLLCSRNMPLVNTHFALHQTFLSSSSTTLSSSHLFYFLFFYSYSSSFHHLFLLLLSLLLFQVLHELVFSLDLSECVLTQEELGLVWRLCPRLKWLDIGVRKGSRHTLSSTGLAHTQHTHTQMHVCIYIGCECACLCVLKITIFHFQTWPGCCLTCPPSSPSTSSPALS